MYNEHTSHSTFAPGGLRTMWTVILLWAGIATDAFLIFGNGLQMVMFFVLPDSSNILLAGDDFDPQSALEISYTFSLIAVGLAAIMHAIIYIATTVAFLLWIHRAYRNLKPLGVSNPDSTPGWAVGSWFVPFLNLVRPYMITKEIWQESDPEVSVETSVTGERYISRPLLLSVGLSVPSFFGWWWGFWIASNVTSNISFRLSRDPQGRDGLTTALSVEILSAILSLIAALLAIKVVRSISQRQDARYTLLAGTSAPPLSPFASPMSLSSTPPSEA